MKASIIDFFLSLLLGLGIIILLSPLGLYWWINGDYERYIWIINGPYPFSHFGGGPFQLWLSISLLLCGSSLVIVYFIGKKTLRSKSN